MTRLVRSLGHAARRVRHFSRGRSNVVDVAAAIEREQHEEARELRIGLVMLAVMVAMLIAGIAAAIVMGVRLGWIPRT